MNNALIMALLNAWAGIHGEYWLLWTFHWRSKGASYYGDHLLYQRLYTARQAEIDRMAEIIAAVGGAALLDPTKAMDAAKPFIESVENLQANDAQKALVATQSVLRLLDVANNAAKGTPYELAINNALSGFSDTHLEAVYLLQQRMSGETVPLSPSQAPGGFRTYGAAIDISDVPPAGALDMGEPDEDKASIYPRQNKPLLPPKRKRQNRVEDTINAFGDLLAWIPGGEGLRTAGAITKGLTLGAALFALISLIRRAFFQRKALTGPVAR
jgi:DNA-binding ferritin-like protein